MQKHLLLSAFILLAFTSFAQSPVVGRWKKISHISEFQGQKMDSHAALLTQRPCADKVVYAINADGTFRLEAQNSGCDEQYIKIQEKLYSKTQWKVDGNKISTSATNFKVSQDYIFTVEGKTMTWKGTNGQGVIVYQKL